MCARMSSKNLQHCEIQSRPSRSHRRMWRTTANLSAPRCLQPQCLLQENVALLVQHGGVRCLHLHTGDRSWGRPHGEQTPCSCRCYPPSGNVEATHESHSRRQLTFGLGGHSTLDRRLFARQPQAQPGGASSLHQHDHTGREAAPALGIDTWLKVQRLNAR